MARIKSLVYSLPMPTSSVCEITDRLFSAPEEFERGAAAAMAQGSIDTTSGVLRRSPQGMFSEIALLPIGLSAVIKISGCEAMQVCEGSEMETLLGPRGRSALAKHRKDNAVAVACWV